MASAALLELAPGEASAQSLDDFLQRTMSDNPQIQSARAQVLVARQDEAIARAGGLPTVEVTGNARSLRGNARFIDGQSPDPIDSRVVVDLALELPLYRGGGIRSASAAARARYRAARADLDRVAGDTLTAVAQAFAASGRDAVILDLHRDNVAMLEEERIESIAGLRQGESSRVDVRQSEARLAAALASFARAEAQRTASIEELAELTGVYPGRLVGPDDGDRPGESSMITDADAERAPEVVAQRLRATAARHDVNVARAARLPQLSFTSGLGYTYIDGAGAGLSRSGSLDRFAGSRATIGISLRMPLYQGGRVGAAIGRARALQTSERARQFALERRSLARIRSERSQLAAASARIAYLTEAVAANRSAVRGVRIDRRLGIRRTIEVLNAEQELFESRRTLAVARAEAFSRAAALFNAAGRATEMLTAARSLRQPSPGPTPVAGWRATDSSRSMPILLASTFDLRAVPNSRVVREAAPAIMRLGYDLAASGVGASGQRHVPYDRSVVAIV